MPTAAVGYVIMQGGDATPDTQPYLKFYSQIGGIWQQTATAPTLKDFEGCTFSVAHLASGNPGEVWFLGWGGWFSSSHATIHARLYSFDGSKVRTIWQRDNLDSGRISANNNTVTLDYFDFDNPSIEKHQVLQATPNGLQLVTESSKQW